MKNAFYILITSVFLISCNKLKYKPIPNKELDKVQLMKSEIICHDIIYGCKNTSYNVWDNIPMTDELRKEFELKDLSSTCALFSMVNDGYELKFTIAHKKRFDENRTIYTYLLINGENSLTPKLIMEMNEKGELCAWLLKFFIKTENTLAG